MKEKPLKFLRKWGCITQLRELLDELFALRVTRWKRLGMRLNHDAGAVTRKRDQSASSDPGMLIEDALNRNAIVGTARGLNEVRFAPAEVKISVRIQISDVAHAVPNFFTLGNFSGSIRVRAAEI